MFFFWPTLVSIFYGNQLPWVGWSTRGIALATVYLIYAKRRDLENTLFTSSQLGLISLLGIVTFYILGTVFNIRFVEQCSVMLMIPALVMICFGPAVIKTLVFPILYLMLVIPLQDDSISGRVSIVWLAVGLFIIYSQYIRFFHAKEVEEGERPAWVYQNSRWLIPSAIAFAMLMVSPWLGDNIRSFYPKKVREVVLRAPLGDHGWEGPRPVESKAWQPFYPNASATIQEKYFSSSAAERDSIYLYAAYYDSDRAMTDMLDPENKIFDPVLWKQTNLTTTEINLGNNNTTYVMEVILKAGAVYRVAWYWYNIAGVSTTDLSLGQVLDKVRVISKHAQGSGLVLISTSFTDSPDEARRRLNSFMVAMYGSLDILKNPEIQYVVQN